MIKRKQFIIIFIILSTIILASCGYSNNIPNEVQKGEKNNKEDELMHEDMYTSDYTKFYGTWYYGTKSVTILEDSTAIIDNYPYDMKYMRWTVVNDDRLALIYEDTVYYLDYYEGNYTLIKSGMESYNLSDKKEVNEGDTIFAIVTSNINMRANASNSSAKLGVLYSGQEVIVLEQVDDVWSHISFALSDGSECRGYVKSEYLKFDYNNVTDKIETSKEEYVDASIEDNDKILELYEYNIGSLTIPLKISNDGLSHYAVGTVSLFLDINHEDYAVYQDNLGGYEGIITGIIFDVLGNHTLDEVKENSDLIQNEILKIIQEKFDSKFIYKISCAFLYS